VEVEGVHVDGYAGAAGGGAVEGEADALGDRL
jgi:hypothetical protein